MKVGAELAKKMEKLMKERNLTKKQLCDLTGMKMGTVKKILSEETKNVNYETINKLCKTLNVSKGFIFGYMYDEETKENLKVKSIKEWV